MSDAKRRLCVVTATRAEYGILKTLIQVLDGMPTVDLQLIVTGSHLDERFGNTREFIDEDGVKIAAEVPLPLGDDVTDTGRAAGHCVTGMVEALSALRPHLMVVVGDRYEIMATVVAATLCNVPVAHIHGGELTAGAIDDAFRHAITKMSHLHFTAAEAYRRRVIQMGENAACTFNFGAPGLDTINRVAEKDLAWLSARVGTTMTEDFFLVTYHPTTRNPKEDAIAPEAMMTALDAFPDYQVLITGVNADPGFGRIKSALEAFAARRPERVIVRQSLGQDGYVTAMRLCRAVIGNSSSGIIEAPFVGVPTVNIGSRQDGRERAPSVIDCPPDAAEIEKAVGRALEPAFRTNVKRGQHLFGDGNAAPRIAEILATFPLQGLATKPFYDMADGVRALAT